MIGISLEIIGYIILPIVTWVVAKYLGYHLTTVNNKISALILMVIVSPIVEEIVFRGVFQDWLLKCIRNKLFVVVILNLGFALIHYRVNTNFNYLIAVFICGVIFSRLKIRLNNLGYPIAMHIYYNAVFWIANT